MDNFKVLDHEVLKVSQVVTEKQTAVVETHHTMFYHITLLVSNANPAINEEITITAEVKTWEGLESDYNQPIIFELEGVQINADIIEGSASIPFSSDTSGEFVIKTVNDRVENKEVVVIV